MIYMGLVVNALALTITIEDNQQSIIAMIINLLFINHLDLHLWLFNPLVGKN